MEYLDFAPTAVNLIFLKLLNIGKFSFLFLFTWRTSCRVFKFKNTMEISANAFLLILTYLR